MSPKLPRFTLQAFLLAVLSLLLVFGPTLGTVVAQGLDLNRHCQFHGRERAVNTDGTAYGWKCEDSSGVLWDISMESACDEQYGSDYTAQYSNYNDPDSWYCQAPASSQPNNPQPQSRGCDISRFDVSPSGTVTLGTAVNLSGESNCGTTKFTINGQSHSETGQPNNSMTWRTNEFGTGNYNVCFLARGNGGWENADSECRSVSVVQQQTQQQPQAQPTQVPATSGTSGSGSCFMPLSIGDRGQITAGVANNLRSGAGTGYSRIGSLQPFTQFTVLDGPFSANGHCWIYIELDDGTTGYTATGSASDPWVEWVSGESTEEQPETNRGNVSIYVLGYTLIVNPRTCAITNGAEVIRGEIEYFASNVTATTGSEEWFREMTWYFELNSGQTDSLRVAIIDAISSEIPRCTSPYYLVGDLYMDMSGPGNVVFGYSMGIWDGTIGELISNWKQAERDGYLEFPYALENWIDFPDDRNQRRLGSSLASQTDNDASEVTIEMIISTAIEVDLQ
jgi:hypothetical protein